MQTKNVSLCFLLQEGEILLAKKKRGFGEGKWNGCGGKLLPGESFETSTIRETQEEIGVEIAKEDLLLVSVLEFYFSEKAGQEAMRHHCPVYFATKWKGEPKESDEMEPRWFDQNKIPFYEMWDDDILWLPRVLKGEKLHAEFWFDQDFKLTKQRISPFKEKAV